LSHVLAALSERKPKVRNLFQKDLRICSLRDFGLQGALQGAAYQGKPSLALNVYKIISLLMPQKHLAQVGLRICLYKFNQGVVRLWYIPVQQKVLMCSMPDM
jgi:hypothetical protein